MLRLLSEFWGIEVAAWQVATSVWVLGIKVAIQHVPGKLQPLFGFWGIKVASWQVATLVWVLGDQIELWPGQSQFISGQSTMLAPDGRQDNLASCLAPYQAVITGNNLPNCLPDIGAVIGWLWAVWPT
ncbi:hypothetical protein B0H14DRAFT_2640308 [Mycena olivaceomarginata]|nr:hypothetical protein B0H14DRAFT_2640308 [Mycena olivaceomarginata]